MKSLFILMFLFVALVSNATNDTLTRAQVYNFNVGDTFDYRILQNDQGDLPHYNEIFERIIITDTQYFQLQDSLFITEEIYQVSQGDSFSLMAIDTLKMDSSSKYAAYDARSQCGYTIDMIKIDTGYNDRIVNSTVFETGLGCYGETASYANGLGRTENLSVGGDGEENSYELDTVLIYYSKVGETWGTPATIAVGIPNIEKQNYYISLYPTVSDGQFNTKMGGANSTTSELAVYDLTGRTIKTISINSGISNIKLDNASAGMYLWSVISGGTVLKSGKLIIQ